MATGALDSLININCRYEPLYVAYFCPNPMLGLLLRLHVVRSYICMCVCVYVCAVGKLAIPDACPDLQLHTTHNLLPNLPRSSETISLHGSLDTLQMAELVKRDQLVHQLALRLLHFGLKITM